MPSPFPGMNPFLEQEYVWHDFHDSFIPFVRDALSTQVLPRHFVKIDEHVYLHELSAEERRSIGRADVGVAPVPNMENKLQLVRDWQPLPRLPWIWRLILKASPFWKSATGRTAS